ncbi:MAG: nucleoside hydrolase [Anaerolineae bacterium]|jgi:purine nucleosidase
MTALKLHLDTDLGGDIDDLCALAIVLGWPGAELIAVTTNSDDGGRRAGYTRYALELAGRGDIPVAAGADVSLGCYRLHPGLPDEAAYWPEPVPPAPGRLDDALSLLERSIEQGAIIAAVGPFTNLALLERRSPGILRQAQLYLMGGYVYAPRAGFPQWGNEMDWNVQADPDSALFVFQRSNPTLIPLSVTVETWLRQADLDRLRGSGPLARLIAKQAEAFAQEEQMAERFGRTCPGLPDDIVNFLHDPLAVAIALGWEEGVEVAELPLRLTLEDGLLHERIEEGGRPTRVVTRVDGDKFSRFWLDTVTRA